MGFWHTNRTDDLMFGSVQACDRLPSTRERAVAAIAYKRPFGNINPDADPSSELVTKVTTRMVP